MSIIHLVAVGDEEPTPAELAEIEREWPLIEAEMNLLDAEIAYATACESVSSLDWRRVRRAENRVLAVTRDLHNHDVRAEVVA
jgi:uncharacterized protein DUF6284